MMIRLHPRETGGAPVAFDPLFRRWNAATRQLEDLSPDEVKANLRPAIKAEARSRILARFPEWKQTNMTARGVELMSVRLARAWTVEEQTEADALQAAWSWIKSIRAASDALEQTAPADFAADKHWPA